MSKKFYIRHALFFTLAIFWGFSAQGQCTILATGNSTCSVNNGVIDIDLNAVPPVNIAWTGPGAPGNLSTSASSLNIPNLIPGVYTLTATDAVGCIATATATITYLFPPNVNITTVPPKCQGESFTLSANGTGAYAWSTGSIAQTIFLSPSITTTYTVTLTNSNGCTASATRTVTVNPLPNVVVTGNTSLCAQSNTTLSASGGANYVWSAGATSADLSVDVSTPTTYTVTVSSTAGCTKSAAVSVSRIVTVSAQVSNQNCLAGASGSVVLSLTGGQSPYTYLWSNGNTTKDLTSINPGTWIVTASDQNGCTSSVSAVVGQALSLDVTTTNATCGTNNGTISTSTTGGAPAYAYLWSNNATTPTISGLSAGVYTLTVTDADGCTATASATISEIPPSTVTISGETIICNQNSLTLTASGAANYIWSNGAAGSTNLASTNNNASTFTVTATDAQGCTSTASVTITRKINLSAQVSNQNCASGSNGSVVLTVSGGLDPYTYAWSSGQTDKDLTNVPAGTYQAVVSDQTGCSSLVNVDIGAALFVSANVSQTSTCGGNSNISTTVFGGAPPYTYLWSNAATTPNISGLSAGTYALTVTDADGCTKTLTSTVIQPSAVTASATSTPVSCNGGSNGTVTVVAGGGTPGYTYLWSNGQATATATGLTAGTYTVTVTDANGCTKTATSTVPQPTTLTVVATPQASTCGASNGHATMTTSGGTMPYTYLWSSTLTTQNITGLAAGTYTVTVTDANGCTKTASATVTTSSGPTVTTTTTPISCAGGNNGTAKATTTGGTAPITYTWSNAQTTATATGLTAGTYTVTVTDANACTKTATATVLQPMLLIVNTTTTNATCGNNNGTASVIVTGGIGAYTYIWSAVGATTQNIANLPPGTYTVTVTDANGCTKTSSATVTNEIGITFNIQASNNPCNGMAGGSINLGITGGNGPFTYLWSNGETTETLNNLPAGAYSVTVTDIVGCSTVKMFTILQPPPFLLLPTITAPSCSGLNNGNITVTVTGGTPPYYYSWSNGATTQSLNNLSAGIYTLTVTDVNGCTSASSFTLTGPTNILLQVQSTQSCGSTSINVSGSSGGSGTLFYNWNNGVSGPINVANSSGTYTVTATDSNGCSNVQSIVVVVVPADLCAFFHGKVVLDANQNCQNDAETGLENWIVRATGINTYYALSNSDGEYLLGVSPGDQYLIEAIPIGTYWNPCPAAQLFAPISLDTLYNVDFPVRQDMLCPELEVSLSSSNLRRCFSSNQYYVSYCNNGTALAENAYVVLSLDAFSLPLSSNLPFINLGNNNYSFQLGDLDPGECNNFNIAFKISCDAVIGQTLCATAHIYPDSTCMPNNALWNGASLAISSSCTSDSLHFAIKNIGFGAMTQSLDYIVVEDHVMLYAKPILLLPNQSKNISVAANGSTWRVAVPQVPYHPGHSMPSLVVEACTQNSTFSTGFVNQFAQDDADPWIDISCKEITGSFDPNDKAGYPNGYGALHYIDKGIALEYQIRFQNTGNDTAFTVQVLDSLSEWLDPATIRPGAASHPYTFNLSGQGIASFTFDNILLPDSMINEPASHGYVQFSIFPKATLPLETVIQNQAAIYFDYNAPIFTNTTWHRLGDHYLVVGLWQPEQPQYELLISPNPSLGHATIQVKGAQNKHSLHLQVIDNLGRTLQELESSAQSNTFQIASGTLLPGIYWFSVTQDGKLLGRGKFVVQ